MSFIQQVVLHQEYNLDPGPGHDSVLVPDHGHYFHYQDQDLKQVCERLCLILFLSTRQGTSWKLQRIGVVF